MQAIETKYLAPTNYLCSRIKATCDRGSLTVEWNHSLGIEGNHRAAAEALIARFLDEDDKAAAAEPNPRHRGERASNPWARPFVTGSIAKSFVHVFTSR